MMGPKEDQHGGGKFDVSFKRTIDVHVCVDVLHTIEGYASLPSHVQHKMKQQLVVRKLQRDIYEFLQHNNVQAEYVMRDPLQGGGYEEGCPECGKLHGRVCYTAKPQKAPRGWRPSFLNDVIWDKWNCHRVSRGMRWVCHPYAKTPGELVVLRLGSHMSGGCVTKKCDAIENENDNTCTERASHGYDYASMSLSLHARTCVPPSCTDVHDDKLCWTSMHEMVGDVSPLPHESHVFGDLGGVTSPHISVMHAESCTMSCAQVCSSNINTGVMSKAYNPDEFFEFVCGARHAPANSHMCLEHDAPIVHGSQCWGIATPPHVSTTGARSCTMPACANNDSTGVMSKSYDPDAFYAFVCDTEQDGMQNVAEVSLIRCDSKSSHVGYDESELICVGLWGLCDPG